MNNLKVNEEKQTKPEWLFSLIGDAKYDASTNTLTLVNKDKLKLLGFTDRPYREQTKYDNATLILELLFNEDNSKDSFSEDPPNAVLVMNNKQVVYELVKYDTKTNTFHLKPLPNHSEYYNHTEDYTGEISLFIDNKINVGSEAFHLAYAFKKWNPIFDGKPLTLSLVSNNSEKYGPVIKAWNRYKNYWNKDIFRIMLINLNVSLDLWNKFSEVILNTYDNRYNSTTYNV